MDEAKHRKLYELLKAEILEGKYGRAGAFPSEAQLVRRHSYSRTTIRKALDELRHDGLIRCSQGKGTRVADFGACRTYGLILPGVSRYEYFQPIATELTRIAQENHSAFLFANIDAMDPEQLKHNVRELAADFIKRRVAGIVYHPIEFLSNDDTANADIVAVFKRAKIPVVLLDSDVVLPPDSSEFDVVSIDNAHAAEKLTWHLLDAGARNVNVLMLPHLFPNMMDRVRGVANAHMLAGRPWSRKNLLISDPTDAKAIKAFMKRRPQPDAFVCQNDALAADFARTLKKLGYKVPGDVLLAGFDGMDISRVMSPSLTTIQQPFADLARIVFDLLQKRVEKPIGLPVRVFLPQKMLIRASTQRMGTKPARRKKCS